jgi:hypothetical protein
MQPLLEAAHADNHSVVRPTHIVRKDEGIIGYLSIGVLPTVLLWMDTKRAKVRDSLAVITFYENLVAPSGGVIIPVQSKSPYYPLMEQAGYEKAGDGTIFLKGL